MVENVKAEDVDYHHSSGAILLDIRDLEEHQEGHIEGSMHISRGKLEMVIEEKIPNLDQEIICYCNANNRGGLSANSLRNMGYRNAKMIEGGLIAYNQFKSA